MKIYHTRAGSNRFGNPAGIVGEETEGAEDARKKATAGGQEILPTQFHPGQDQLGLPRREITFRNLALFDIHNCRTILVVNMDMQMVGIEFLP